MHLEDLYVHPEYWGQGIGHALLSSVAAAASDRDCRRLELSVLNWNEGAIEFHQRSGAQSLDDWTTMRFTGPALLDLAAEF